MQAVLIIEDDPALLRGLRDNFEAQGFSVQVAVDGEEGLALALTGGADLILLDIMLPKMDGFEVCRILRDRGRDVPIIMLTAKGQEEDIVCGLNLGADDYVTKPFQISELLARARAFLRRRAGLHPASQHFGEFELDRRSHRLLRGGEEIPLTPKEFRLLDHFLANAGRALTRENILAAVWGSSVVVSARSVDRCIRTLRAKIEPRAGGPRLIRTIPEIGYRFEIPESD